MTTIQAIDLLKDLEQSLDDYCELNDEGKTAFRMAITALELFGNAEQLPSVQPEQRWIPCDKGEPDEDMECWVTVKTTDALYRGNFTKRYGERRDRGFITSVGFMRWNTALAWMPIYVPKPYRTEGDDNHEG